MHSNIGLSYAEALYRTVLASRPSIVVEIGMAFGVSSLAILAALDSAGEDGQLISIDPNQSTEWSGCGIAAVERAGLALRHRLMEEPDYTALPKLLESKTRVDFAFIDGWHTFDYALLDFWYLDKMLAVGGIVGFDDCDFPPVRKVVQFVLSHRHYDEVSVGLPVAGENYSGSRGVLKRLMGRRLLSHARRLTGRPQCVYAPRNRYLRKTQDWEPDWPFFADF